MNKKGFTLIELMGVLILISILTIVIIPTIVKVLKDNKTKLYNTQVDLIENAARLWGSDNDTNLSKTETIYLPVNDLLNEGYIDNEDIVDPRNTNKKLTGCVYISYASKKWTYKYVDSVCP